MSDNLDDLETRVTALEEVMQGIGDEVDDITERAVTRDGFTPTLTGVERRSAVLMTRAVAMLDTADDPSLSLSSRERDALRTVAAQLKHAARDLLRG